MDVKQLNTFLTICQYKNYTQASDHLGYAQSTVSSQIQSLEKEYDIKLFEKIGRSIYLTKEGVTFMYYAKQIIATEQLMQQDLQNISNQKQLLRIGIAESLCYHYFPEVSKAFTHLFPQVELKLIFADSHSLPNLLNDNEIDIGLSLSHLIRHKNITVLHKQRACLALFANPNHPLSSALSIELKDLLPYPFFLTAKGCSYRAELEHILNQAFITPRVELETDSKELLKRFTMNSNGITFLPETTVLNEINEKKLCKLKLNAEFDIWYQILVHRDRKISSILQAFIDCLIQTKL